MKKGNYGISFAFYATVAMIMAMLGWTTALMLLTGFVIVAEKDEWTIKQCLQAVVVVLFKDIISIAISYLEKPFTWLGYVIEYSEDTEGFFKFVTGYDKFWSFAQDVLFIVVLVFIIIAIFKVAKGKDAKIPVVDLFVNWAYGVVLAKIPVAAATGKKCPKCGEPVSGKFCDKCGSQVED